MKYNNLDPLKRKASFFYYKLRESPLLKIPALRLRSLSLIYLCIMVEKWYVLRSDSRKCIDVILSSSSLEFMPQYLIACI